MDRGLDTEGFTQPLMRRDLDRTVLGVQVNNRDTLSHLNSNSIEQGLSGTRIRDSELTLLSPIPPRRAALRDTAYQKTVTCRKIILGAAHEIRSPVQSHSTESVIPTVNVRDAHGSARCPVP